MPFNYQSAVRKTYTRQPISKGESSDSPPLIISSSSSASKTQILWVGCSDSLVLETECLGSGLRENMFVHRNLGALVSNGDLSTLSAIEWCVGLLKVDHIIVCGHYDCALIHVRRRDNAEALNGWYKDACKLHDLSDEYLSTQPDMDEKSKDARFEEVFVLAEVDWLRRQENVRKAVEERGLQIHAFVYDKEKNACVRLVEGDELSGKES